MFYLGAGRGVSAVKRSGQNFAIFDKKIFFFVEMISIQYVRPQVPWLSRFKDCKKKEILTFTLK